MPNEDRYMDELVDQLHACLAEALLRSRREPFVTPVTVAEIYQDLVPYRTVRSRLGFEMNADYEHTLLRLLAGEGSHARLEPREAREELQAELETPNPNVGLFRKFAACDVWIAAPREGGGVGPGEVEPADATPAEAVYGDAASAVAATSDPESESARVPDDRSGARDPSAWHHASGAGRSAWDEPAVAGGAWDDMDAPELLLDDEVVDDADIVDAILYKIPPAMLRPDEAVASTLDSQNGRAAMPNASSQCGFCDSNLPSGRAVKFCPFCGADQTMRPCSACGEALANGWRFCIACGTQTTVPAPAG